MIERFIYNLSKNDPGAHILAMVIKVACIMISYFLFAWSCGYAYEVMVWSFYFLAFAAMACAVGDIKSRRQIFLYFAIGFAVCLSLSESLYPYKILSFLIVIISAYFAFWLRKFGGRFKLFPGYLVIVLAISSMQLPVLPNQLIELYISLVVVSIAFVILILWLRPWDTPKQLSRVLQIHAIMLQKEARFWLEEITRTNKYQLDFKNGQKELNMALDTLHERGATWIISPIRKIAWHRCYGRYQNIIRTIFRILFFYQSLLIKNSPAVKVLVKQSALQEIIFMATKAPLWPFMFKKEQDFELQISQLKSLTEGFKSEVLSHPPIKGCHVVLFELLLLLESLQYIIIELKGAVDELA